MHWDDEELRAWEDLHSKKGEDVLLLQQFIDEDTAQFKVNLWHLTSVAKYLYKRPVVQA